MVHLQFVCSRDKARRLLRAARHGHDPVQPQPPGRVRRRAGSHPGAECRAHRPTRCSRCLPPRLKIVPASSHEAESAIASAATKATCFVRALILGNGQKVYGPTAMLGDNDALFKTVKHEGNTARVRHYERATLLFKRAVLLLLLVPFKIADTDMVADIFTKAVEKAKYTRVRDFMMNVHSSLRVQLESGLITAVGASHRMICSLMRRL